MVKAKTERKRIMLQILCKGLGEQADIVNPVLRILLTFSGSTTERIAQDVGRLHQSEEQHGPSDLEPRRYEDGFCGPLPLHAH